MVNKLAKEMNRTEGKALLTPIVRFFISCCGVEPVEREGLLIRYIAQQRMNWPTKGARGKKRRPNCSSQPLSAPHALPRSSRMPLSLTMKIISGPTHSLNRFRTTRTSEIVFIGQLSVQTSAGAVYPVVPELF